MAGELLKALIITSLAGSVLTIIISLLKPITKNVFGYKWHYYIWLTVLVTMLLPVRFAVLQTNTVRIISENTQQAQYTPHSEIDVSNAAGKYTLPDVYAPSPIEKSSEILANFINNCTSILFLIWLLGIFINLSVSIGGYIRLIQKVHKNSVIISCPELLKYTGRKITVYRCKNFTSPFIMGILRPSLILPDIDLTSGQLDNILMHEMTHFLRYDILYKWAAAIVKVLHWFNPFIYYVSRQINTECEISCDLSVVGNMDEMQKKEYVNTIISLLCANKTKSIPLTTGMTGTKKDLMRRFTMIKNRKTTSKIISALSAMIAGVMLGTTVFASGVLSDITAQNDSLEIIGIDGNIISLVNKPFEAYGQVYVPLREIIYKVGYDDNTCSLQWNSGVIDLTLINYPADNAKWRMKIGSSTLSLRRFRGNEMINYEAANEENSFIFGISLNDAPIVLSNSTAYIPLEQLNYMVYSYTNKRDTVTNQLCEITYKSYDQNNTGSIRTSEYPNTSPEYAVSQFFWLFSNGDFENMKRYCTEDFINTFFGDGHVFGMARAELSGMHVDPLEYAKSSNGFNISVNVTMTPYESSAYDPSKTEESFEVRLLRQPDGRYLINEFTR